MKSKVNKVIVVSEIYKLHFYKFILVISSICISISCKNHIDCGGNKGYSKTSIESKKNGVFISDYYAPNMQIIVPSKGIKIKIEEIFREHQFKVINNNEIMILDDTQIIIKTKHLIPDSYLIEWKIKNDENIIFYGGNYVFDAELKNISKLDTLQFKIVKDKYSDNENEIIGELILIEKTR